MKLERDANGGNHLLLDNTGTACRFLFLGLRDNCPECRSPNGQRLHESKAIDPNIRAKSFSHNDNELHIVWSDDTESTYPLDFLTAWAYDKLLEQTALTIKFANQCFVKLIRLLLIEPRQCRTSHTTCPPGDIAMNIARSDY